jgi:hypothetical protein
MDESKPGSFDRRGFIKGAAAGAVAATTPGTVHAHDDHQDIPSDPALRVKALESLLVEKGLVDPAGWPPYWSEGCCARLARSDV